jgi:hypothetical protein
LDRRRKVHPLIKRTSDPEREKSVHHDLPRHARPRTSDHGTTRAGSGWRYNRGKSGAETNLRAAGCANQSLSTIEPVCGTPRRKLENGEQRLAPETRRSKAESPETVDQRLGRASLTRGNVGGSYAPGNRTRETELRGWACRIRTCKCHFGKCPLKCRTDFA